MDVNDEVSVCLDIDGDAFLRTLDLACAILVAARVCHTVRHASEFAVCAKDEVYNPRIFNLEHGRSAFATAHNTAGDLAEGLVCIQGADNALARKPTALGVGFSSADEKDEG